MSASCESGAASAARRSGKEYWRSLEDLADTPEFREFVFREFPASATEMLESSDRRQFLKIMGASMALAGAGGLAGCRRWPETFIAPYAHRPVDRAPGVSVHYATSMEFAGVGAGLLVTSYDGRPIKIDGNPEHPMTLGSSTAMMQASMLDLYDPDRSRSPMHQGRAATWADFTAWAKTQFAGVRNSRGNGLAFLCEATSSPSVLALRRRLLERDFPNATWHEYEPINNDGEVGGSQLAFGGAYRAMYNFAEARTIVALDADFLGLQAPGQLKWCRDYAASRRVDDGAQPSRLYVFESGLTITGANADHRVAMRHADVAAIAAWLASQLGVPGVPPSLASGEIETLPDHAALEQVKQHLLADLRGSDGHAAAGPSIVIAGPRQPAEVHALAHMINRALGNAGRTITYARLESVEPHAQSIRSLAQRINEGQVQTLVILGGNPAYNAPADLDFAGLLAKVQTSIHLSDYVDETSAKCTWHVNRAHYLEAWSDSRAYDGTWTIGQPLILPLFEGRTPAELLATLAGETGATATSYELTRAAFALAAGGANFEANWRGALIAGFIPQSAFPAAEAPSAARADFGEAMRALEARRQAGRGEIEVVFAADASVYDGRLANNGWMQELPDPIAKLTWDNAALVSPAFARAQGLRTGDMVEITCNGRTVSAPVMVIPGQFTSSVTLPLGYGREFQGRICQDAGFNFYPLRTSEAMHAAAASIRKTGDRYVLATTQDHFSLDNWPGGAGVQERLPSLFREATLATYRENPKFAKERAHVVTRLSLFPEDHPFHRQTGAEGDWPRADYAWGMSIDLNTCTGCNACVIACQAENNIPIVGKDQVKRGREMHWIRVDRYFKGTQEQSPSGFMLAPVPCMHCENAPCEQVCPVAATTHDSQGLNVMVYNRCIGTRYCSNNCPYKVRRFNYFDYWARPPHREQPGLLLHVEPEYYSKAQAKPEPLRQLQMNPEVTVRMRGIMEKCTYCMQRIARARIETKNLWVRLKNLDPGDPRVQDVRVPIPDGTFTTACAAACPARAITFGDLKDKSSRVAAMHRHPRAYEMLEELNTKPRTRYLAKIRNPAFGGETADAAAHGH